MTNGAMYIFMHPDADHGVSVTHPAEFRNGTVELKFMLEHEKDTLGLNFADLQYKKVWAGHLFKVVVGIHQTELTDLKTGVMDMEIRKARQTKTLTPQQKAELKTRTKRFPHELELVKWYVVKVDVQDDTLTVSIDGKGVGSFSSPGIAHPTKRMLRLSVHRNVVVDDVKIYSLPNE